MSIFVILLTTILNYNNEIVADIPGTIVCCILISLMFLFYFRILESVRSQSEVKYVEHNRVSLYVACIVNTVMCLGCTSCTN